MLKPPRRVVFPAQLCLLSLLLVSNSGVVSVVYDDDSDYPTVMAKRGERRNRDESSIIQQKGNAEQVVLPSMDETFFAEYIRQRSREHQDFLRTEIALTTPAGVDAGAFDPHPNATDHEHEVQTEEQRLLRHLMKTYDKHVRPVFNHSEAVVVSLQVTLIQVFDIDERSQSMITNVWLDHHWFDQRLLWHHGVMFPIETIEIPPFLIWKPDIVVYNSQIPKHNIVSQSLARVHHKGEVFWPPIMRFVSTCALDLTFFPFDSQICLIKLGSWLHNGHKLDLKRHQNYSKAITKHYISNGKWELIETKMVRKNTYYPCCVEPFPDITLYIHMKRRMLYYFYSVVFPVSSLSGLALLEFCLPCESGEKVTLGLTVLLAYSVFSMSIIENMPQTSNFIPLIGVFLNLTQTTTIISIISSVLIINIHVTGDREVRPPPDWILKYIVNGLGKLLYVGADLYIDDMQATTDNAIKVNLEKNRPMQPQYTSKSNKRESNSHGSSVDGTSETSSSAVSVGPEKPAKQTVIQNLRKFLHTQIEHDGEDIYVRQWHLFALTTDRFLFILFVTLNIFASVIILVVVPLFQENVSIDQYLHMLNITENGVLVIR